MFWHWSKNKYNAITLFYNTLLMTAISEARLWYNAYKWDKCTLSAFKWRVAHWRTYEEAIIKDRILYNPTEAYLYYYKHTWEKCKYNKYYRRVKKWIPFDKAISTLRLAGEKRTITKITRNWRVCSICLKNKDWKDYYPWAWYNNKETRCKDCSLEAKKLYGKKYADKIKERKDNYRKTERWKRLQELDYIFYRDENIKKIIKIQWRHRNKKEVSLDKYYYFLNRWYNKKELEELYLQWKRGEKLGWRNEIW